MKPNQIIELFIQDVAVELNDEFDRNFERKAFFDETWPAEKLKNSNGSLMNRTGTLRASISNNILNDIISWQSSLPYSEIHNTGGKIKITQKMRNFFWAMYYKNIGNTLYDIKTKSAVYDDAPKEAIFWKALALKKIGDEITIPKRQFIGNHPRVHEVIQDVFNDMENELNNYVLNNLNK